MIVNPNEAMMYRQLVLDVFFDEKLQGIMDNKIKTITITVQPELGIKIDYDKITEAEKLIQGKFGLQLRSDIKSIKEQQKEMMKKQGKGIVVT